MSQEQQIQQTLKLLNEQLDNLIDSEKQWKQRYTWVQSKYDTLHKQIDTGVKNITENIGLNYTPDENKYYSVVLNKKNSTYNVGYYDLNDIFWGCRTGLSLPQAVQLAGTLSVPHYTLTKKE